VRSPAPLAVHPPGRRATPAAVARPPRTSPASPTASGRVFATASSPRDEVAYLDGDPYPFEPADYMNKGT
jgi:hypothetical protein